MMEKVELRNHVDILSGYAFDASQFNDTENGIPLIRIRDVGKNYSKTFFPGEFDNKFVITNGDFLIGMDGNFRLSEWKGGKALLNQRVCKISVSKPKELLENYLLHFLPKELKEIENTTSFATVKHLSVEKIKKIKIPLPPFSTQQKIAAILDKADELRQYNKELIEKYDALTQSLFLDMFGDPVRNDKGWKKIDLVDVCSKITDGTHKTPVYLENGVTFLSAKNIKNFKLNCLQPKFISNVEHLELSRRCNVGYGDILITKSGSLGMAAIVEFEFEFSIFESLALIKYIRNQIVGTFLLYFLNTKSTQQQYKDITKGVGVKHLHLTDLRKLQIISPPIVLQNQFAERVQAIEAQKLQAQEALEKSEQLFQGLLQKAFKGELV